MNLCVTRNSLEDRLEQKGIDNVNAKNSDGETALKLASRYEHTDIVELLERFKQEMLKKKSKKAQGGD